MSDYTFEDVMWDCAEACMVAHNATSPHKRLIAMTKARYLAELGRILLKRRADPNKSALIASCDKLIYEIEREAFRGN